MSVIGQTLKEARTKKSVTLEEVHAKIKIHPRILQLLEEEKFEKLPSPLFAKSFLRSYAEFLGVDVQSLLEGYEKEKPAAAEPEQVLYLKPASSAGAPRLSLWQWAGGLVAILVIVGILFGSPAKILSTLASKKVTLIKNENKRPTPAPVKELIGSEWLNHVQRGNFPKISKQTPLLLEIKALDTVWLHVTADGAVVFQGILKRGTAESRSAADSIEIWTGNASNMSLTLNKTSLGSPGKGVVKKMILSHEGVRIGSQSSS